MLVLARIPTRHPLANYGDNWRLPWRYFHTENSYCEFHVIYPDGLIHAY